MKIATKATIVGIVISVIMLLFPIREVEAEDVIIVQLVHQEKIKYEYSEGENGGIKQVEIENILVPCYIVGKGETIKSISKSLNVTEEYLLSKNSDFPLSIEEEIPFGIYLELPDIYWKDVQKKVYCQVSRGDCLSKISSIFHISIEEICQLNPQMDDPNLIYTGSMIKIR